MVHFDAYYRLINTRSFSISHLLQIRLNSSDFRLSNLTCLWEHEVHASRLNASNSINANKV